MAFASYREDVQQARDTGNHCQGPHTNTNTNQIHRVASGYHAPWNAWSGPMH